MNTFDNIKVGDKVIYCPAWGIDVIATVTKVTPVGNFATDKTGETLWNKYGYPNLITKWGTSQVIEYSEEYAKEITESTIIAKAVDMMRKCSHSDLTVDQAKSIIDILEDN